jgi:hypothetical protein
MDLDSREVFANYVEPQPAGLVITYYSLDQAPQKQQDSYRTAWARHAVLVTHILVQCLFVHERGEKKKFEIRKKSRPSS